MMKINIFFDSIQNNVQKCNDYVIQNFQNIRYKTDSKSNRAYQEYEYKELKLRIFKF